MSDYKPIFSESGRLIGTVNGDRLEMRRRNGHILRRPTPSWSIDVAALEAAEAAGARFVLITTDQGQRYLASIADIFDLGLYVDFGHGRQYALPLDEWRAPSEPEQ